MLLFAPSCRQEMHEFHLSAEANVNSLVVKWSLLVRQRNFPVFMRQTEWNWKREACLLNFSAFAYRQNCKYKGQKKLNTNLKLLQGWNPKRDKLIWPSRLWRTGHHIPAGSHLTANILLSSLKNPAGLFFVLKKKKQVLPYFLCYLQKYTSSSGRAERWVYLHVVWPGFYLFLWKVENYERKTVLEQLICISSAIFQKLDTAQTCESYLSRFVPQEEIHQACVCVVVWGVVRECVIMCVLVLVTHWVPKYSFY